MTRHHFSDKKLSTVTTQALMPIGTLCMNCGSERGDAVKCESWDGKKYGRHVYNKDAVAITTTINRYIKS